MRRTVCVFGLTMLVASALVGCGKKEAVRPAPEAPAAAAGSAAAPAKPEAAKPEEVVRPPHEQPPTAVQWDAPAVTGDWAGYLGGPTRSGRREVAPITKPVIAWSAQVGIQGYANTVLTSGDTIFLGSQGEFWNKSDKSDSVIALRAADGRQIWRVPTDSDVNGTMLAKDLVIAVTDSGTVYAIQRTSGEIKWQLGAECGMQHPPVQVGDELVFTREEGVTTVSLETGKIVDALTACRRNQRTAISAADGVVYAVHPREGLMAYSAGKPLWKLERPDPELTGFTSWQPPTWARNCSCRPSSAGPSRPSRERDRSSRRWWLSGATMDRWPGRRGSTAPSWPTSRATFRVTPTTSSPLRSRWQPLRRLGQRRLPAVLQPARWHPHRRTGLLRLPHSAVRRHRRRNGCGLPHPPRRRGLCLLHPRHEVALDPLAGPARRRRWQDHPLPGPIRLQPGATGWERTLRGTYGWRRWNALCGHGRRLALRDPSGALVAQPV